MNMVAEEIKDRTRAMEDEEITVTVRNIADEYLIEELIRRYSAMKKKYTNIVKEING